jgi:hypothetical protein
VTETPYGATGAGAVVLEIGAGTGALVVCTPADLANHEIEISPAGEPTRRRHASVRERRGSGGTGYAALYDRLPPGTYTIWRNHITPAATITIAGGQVTSYAWPAGSPHRMTDSDHLRFRRPSRR